MYYTHQEKLAVTLLDVAFDETDRDRKYLLVCKAVDLVAASQIRQAGAAETVLDIAGLVPIVGEVADGINALMLLAKGDYIGAALSAISMIPEAGDAVGKGGKLAIWMTKLVTKGGKLGKLSSFILKHSKQFKSVISKAVNFLKTSSDAIYKSIDTLEKVVNSGGDEKAMGDMSPLLRKVVSLYVGKSKGGKQKLEKAKPYVGKLKSVVDSVLKSINAAPNALDKLESQAQQETANPAAANPAARPPAARPPAAANPAARPPAARRPAARPPRRPGT